MLKKNRSYILEVEPNDGNELIRIDFKKAPFTLEFDVQHNIMSGANVCSIRVYNLSEANRNAIRHDRINVGNYRRVTLKAGYGDTLLTIFDGNIMQAWSIREGTNFITEMQSFDGGFAYVNGRTNLQFGAAATSKQKLDTLVSSLPHVSKGVIGDFPESSGTPNSYSDSTVNVIKQIISETDANFFISKQKAYCLKKNECIAGSTPIINSVSGLLNTPVREETFLNFDMIFEPRLEMAQFLTLQSRTEKSFNGQWKVISLKHKGIISPVVCGDAITSVGLMQGNPSIGALRVVA